MEENTILIVDDEVEICQLLSKMLEKEGYKVSSAHTIKDGKEIIKDKSFDFVFLDLNLPDGIGTKLVSTIKKQEKKTKVLVISAYHGIAEINSKAKKEIAGFIGKPFSKPIVLRMLEKIKQEEG